MDLAQMTAELAQRKAFLPGKTVKLDFAEDGAIVLDGVDGQVTNNQEAQADTTLHISWDDWRALASGKLDPVSAYMQGKLMVDGSMSLAMQMQPLLAERRAVDFLIRALHLVLCPRGCRFNFSGNGKGLGD